LLTATAGAVCASTPIISIAQSTFVGASFVASTQSEAQFFPPDTMGAAGPTQIALLINGRYEYYNKDSSGTALNAGGVDLNTFWFNAGIASLPGFGAFDPRIEYDPNTQRWYASSAAGQDTSSTVYVAVSKTANLQDGWRAVSIKADTTSQKYADFPMLGFDADGIYLNANMINVGTETQLSTSLWAIPKSDLLSSTPTAANRVTFTNLPSTTAQPTVVLDQTGLSNYPFTLFRNGNGSLSRVTVSGSFPSSLSLNPGASAVALNSGLTVPVDARQPDNTANLDIDSDRISAYTVRRDGSYWIAQTRYNATDHTTAADDVIRWMQVNASTATEQQEGVINIPGQDVRYASIAVNSNGTVVMGFTASGTNAGQYPAAYAVVGTTSNGLTTFGAPFLLQAGTASFHETDHNNTNRWGDYSATSVDPADPNIFWTFQEYATGVTDWTVQASEIVTNQPGEAYWKNAVSGTTSNTTNWAAASLPGSGDHVIFSRPAAAYTVNLDAPLTNNRASVRQGTVTWNLNGNAWTLTNSSQSTPSLTISEFQGTSNLTVTGGGTLSTVNATIASGIGSNGSLTVSGSGTTWHNSDSVVVAGTNSAAGGVGALTIASGASTSITNTLKIWTGGTVTVSGSASAGRVIQNGGTLAITGNGYLHLPAAGRATSSTSVLSSTPLISGNGRLDLEDNAVIVNYSSDTTHATRDAIRNLLKNGRNAAPGTSAPWNGAGGIMSSYANVNGDGFSLAIGYADNADLVNLRAAGSYSAFGGQTVASNTVLIQLTRGADATLDGNVDGQDVAIVGTHFQKPNSGQWEFGDFDYSGTCDGGDVAVLGTTFGKTSPVLSPAQMTAEFGSAFTAAFEAGQTGTVPEPFAGPLVLSAISLLALRCRRKRATLPS